MNETSVIQSYAISDLPRLTLLTEGLSPMGSVRQAKTKEETRQSELFFHHLVTGMPEFALKPYQLLVAAS